MKRVLVPVSLELPWQGPQKARPHYLLLIVGAIQIMRPWRFFHGARLVPWRSLQPIRAGFDPPALHFHSS